jgi:hypothetical protein
MLNGILPRRLSACLLEASELQEARTMADDNPFQVIRDAILNASANDPAGDKPGVSREQLSARNADHYARAVLVALEHSGFEVVRHTPEPPDDD